MAKNKVFIDIVIDDKGTTKRVAVNAKKLGLALDDTASGAQKTKKHTDDLSKSNKDLDRNFRGTAKMSSNMTKNFSKQQQGMGGLVGAYATLAAQVFAVTAAFQFLGEASQFRNLIAGQEALGAVTGTAFKTITNSIIEATDAQLRYGEAARAAAIGTAAGVTSSQLTRLAEAAKNVSFALGRDLTDSFNRLVRGVTKAEPELLDELGIILRLEPATQKYAQAIGKSVSELNAFERTQAVTNEVLDQAESKFAAIAIMMDEDATALARFTKSFDELLNTFKIGLIKGLVPVLEFLTKNTEALVASFALLALPILRSILPAFDSWIEKSKVLQAENQTYVENYKKGIADQVAAQKELLQSQTQNAKQAQKRAQQVLKGDKESAGLNFMRGEGADDDKNIKRQQAASAKILSNAQAQLREHREVQSGYLEGKNQQEVNDLQKSHDKRAAIVKDGTNKQVGFVQAGVAKSRLAIMSLPVVASTAFQGMVSAARIAAVGMNLAFSAVAAIGVLTLIVQAYQGVMKVLYPASEEQKRQTGIISDLTDKYRTLNDEVKRSAEARRDVLFGTDLAANAANVLESVGIQQFIEDINKLSTLDQDTEGFRLLQGKLAETNNELIKINPLFKALRDNILDPAAVDPAVAKGLVKVTNATIDAGNVIDNLPNRIKDANAAFAKLGSSFIKSTPLSNFVDSQKLLLDDLVSINKSSSQAIQDLGTEQQSMLKTVGDQQAEVGALGAVPIQFKARGKETEGYKKYMADLAAINEKYGGTLEENTAREKNLQQRQGEAFKQRTRNNALFNEINERYTKGLKLETELIINARVLSRLEREALSRQTQGITLGGKAANLALERVAQTEKLAKAENAVKEARLAVDLSNEKEKPARREALFLAIENRKNVGLEVEFERLVTSEKLKQIQYERELLRLSAQSAATSREKADIEFRRGIEERTGGGTLASRQALLALDKESLENDVKTATDVLNRAEVAAAEKRRQALEEVDRRNQQAEGSGGLFGSRAMARSRRRTALGQLERGPEELARLAALQKQQQAQARLNEFEQEKLTLFLKQNLALREQAANRLNDVGITQAQRQVREQLRIAEEQQIVLSTEQVDLIRQQAAETELLSTMAEQKQAIFDSISGGLANAFNSIITGSQSAGEAFKGFAKSVLAAVARMLAEMIALQVIMAAIGFATSAGAAAGGGIMGTGTSPGDPFGQGFGGSTVIRTARYGMKAPREYATGGIARGPQAGYPAVLHGTEAVVPMPHGSIPVEFKGDGASNNNVTVNVTMNSDGSTQTRAQSDGQSAAQLGTAISAAVQQELQNQKRSGGLLSPYGAA